MNKSIYDHMPSVVERYDGNNDLVNLNITEVTKEMGEESIKEWEADTIVVPSPASYGVLVDALVRERYSVSEELAILRQRDSKADEFAEYNTYVETCKTMAKVIK